MALTLRQSGLSSTVGQDRKDYTVFSGEWPIGRIYEELGGLPELRWFWSMHGVTDGTRGMVRDGHGATLEDAKRQVGRSWEAWKAWAKLKEME